MSGKSPDTGTWNEQTVSILKTMWERGESAQAIAIELSKVLGYYVSRSAVIGKAHRLGLARHQNSYTAAAEGDGFNVPRPPPNHKSYGSMRVNIAHRRKRMKKAAALQPTKTMLSNRGHGFKVIKVADPVVRGITMDEDHQIPLKQRRTLLELTDQTCKWPIGDGGEPDFFFCGGETVAGLPYCAGHCRMAYAGRPSPKVHVRQGPIVAIAAAS